MSDYIIRGREIYSAKGKCVATLDDNGNPVMAPGMAGAHSRGVQEFLILTTKDTKGTKDFSPAPQGTQEDGMEDPASSRDYAGASTEDFSAPQGTQEEKVTMYTGGNIPAAKPEGTQETVPGKETVEEWEISTIPEDRLPPFSRSLGVNTPGFSEYIVRHKLTMPQVAALVKRLSR